MADFDDGNFFDGILSLFHFSLDIDEGKTLDPHVA